MNRSQATPAPAPERGVHYAWIVAGVVFVTMLGGAGIRSAPGVLFGKEDGGIMFGWIVAGHQIGAATAALGAGTLRTVLGTYEQAFLTAGALCLVVALLALRIGMRTKRQGQMAAATA
jgi:hypothetical protein